MEKISGILPATARITSVDMRNSGVARSGTPGFGRELGVSTVAAKNAALETAAKANLTHKDQIQMRNTESDPKSEIVRRMADSFFVNNMSPSVEANDEDLAVGQNLDVQA